MPKSNIDYSKGIIYKLVSKDLNIKDCYIGSTTNFNKRKNSHKSDCVNEKNPKFNLKVYQFIRENGNFENWDMVEIEKWPCNDKNELFKRERYHYELSQPSLNMCFPQRTTKEYFENYYALNKEKIDEKNMKYYYDNQEELSKKSLEYYHKNHNCNN